MESVVNANKVKQAFLRLAKKSTEALDTEIRGERMPGNIGSLPMIRRGVVLTQDASEAFIEALDENASLTETDGAWSKFTVDDILSEHLENVLRAPASERADVIRSQAQEIERRFREPPSDWVVDLLLYGIDSGCAGLKFGKLEFVADDVNVPPEYLALPEFPVGTHLFARLISTAIDEQSASHRASSIADEHLMVLNALCQLGSPSLTRVSLVKHAVRTYSLHRTGRSRDSMAPISFQGNNTNFTLRRPELEAVLTAKLGKRISEMLLQPDNEFRDRLLRGYALAGAASVDVHPERSFLMFAISLESLILGRDTKSELTHQLAMRVAHLIGNGSSGRKHVATWVEKLYDRRSKIVHRGEYGLSRTESGLIRFYCMAALGILALSPSFEGFTKSQQLEEWFDQRMLEGPDPTWQSSSDANS
jgi:hypothetical protein